MSIGIDKFHWYGNWGGPGVGGGEAIDTLDSTYELHDKMYAVLGDYNPIADGLHTAIAPLAILDPNVPLEGKVKGLASAALFGITSSTIGPVVNPVTATVKAAEKAIDVVKGWFGW